MRSLLSTAFHYLDAWNGLFSFHSPWPFSSSLHNDTTMCNKWLAFQKYRDDYKFRKLVCYWQGSQRKTYLLYKTHNGFKRYLDTFLDTLLTSPTQWESERLYLIQQPLIAPGEVVPDKILGVNQTDPQWNIQKFENCCSARRYLFGRLHRDLLCAVSHGKLFSHSDSPESLLLCYSGTLGSHFFPYAPCVCIITAFNDFWLHYNIAVWSLHFFVSFCWERSYI